jgi:pSer/pThr/pTyr-binding forkhead associated (FHA) protein
LRAAYRAVAPQVADPKAAGGVRLIPSHGESLRVGRGLAADPQFDDPGVSRRQALFLNQGGAWLVADAHGVSGVLVDGERVETRFLEDGDEGATGGQRIYFLTTGSS